MMNDRIKQLAEQSKVTVLTTKGHEMVKDGCYIVSPDKLQQFAELIVQECADIAAGERSGWEARMRIEETFRS